ncbi:MAG: ATP-binding protein [Rhodospirillales bacterium]|nr:ATP-binding protein [Rhodospirillales bacterium]
MEELEEVAPNFIMMVGLPGSGKSTVARQLLTDLADKAYVVLCPDDIVIAMGKPEGLTYTQSVQKFSFKKAEKIFMAQLKQALADRKNIIVDRTNLMVGIRAGLLRDIPPDYTKTAMICEVEPDVLRRRLDNRAKRTGKIISEKVLTQMIEAYQPPTRSEFDEIKRVRFVRK